MAGQPLQAGVVVRLPKSLSIAFAGGKIALPAQDANGAVEGLVVHSAVLGEGKVLSVDSLHFSVDPVIGVPRPYEVTTVLDLSKTMLLV